LVASAGRTALKPVETAKDLVTAPGKTVGEAWKGVGGWFNRVDASMSATDPNREGTVASLTGGSKARRKLAYDLGVDPYTTFEPLNAELTRVASASAVGDRGEYRARLRHRRRRHRHQRRRHDEHRARGVARQDRGGA
jgi:hypothetical protein